MESIPFSLDLGMSTLRGILRLERHDLVIEWRRFDIMDNPQGDLESIRVPYTSLERVTCEKRLVGARVSITAGSASAFAGLPLPNGEISTLRAAVKRSDRADAPGWAAEAGLRIAEAEEPRRLQE